MIFFVFGHPRSGNHAVIHWIANQFDKCVFFNNCGSGRFKFSSWHCMSLLGKEKYDSRYALGMITIPTSSNIIYSWEDLDINANLSNIKQENHDHKIIIYRDFFNWISSRIKMIERDHKDNAVKAILQKGQNWCRSWKQYYNIIQKENSFTSIYYNEWLSNRTCRENIAHKFGITTIDDSTMSAVLNYGGGSSFDGLSCYTKAQQMDVLNRFSYINQTNPIVREYICKLYYQDKELQEYAVQCSPDIASKWEELTKDYR